MEYGHIVISSHFGKLDSQVIKWFTGSYFSHSLFTAPMCDRLLALEATGPGTQAIPFDIGYDQNENEDYVMYEVQVSQEIKDEAIRKSLDDLEKSYGYYELPWFAWRRINLWLGRDIKNQDNWSQAGIICSEFASNYLRYCGLGHLFDGFGEGSINAQDLYEICKANPKYFIEVKRKIRNPEDKRL